MNIDHRKKGQMFQYALDYLEHRLSIESSEKYELHLKNCLPCTEQLSDLVKQNDFCQLINSMSSKAGHIQEGELLGYIRALEAGNLTGAEQLTAKHLTKCNHCGNAYMRLEEAMTH